MNPICGVMISMLDRNEVNYGFQSLFSKLKTLKLVFGAYLLNAQHKRVAGKTSCLGISIMCPSGVTCLPANCCFGELAL